MITVKATREGLPGVHTASGYIIDRIVPFVALPSVAALHRFVRITNPANGKSTLAIVLDVGPWNTHDDAYVFQPATAPPPPPPPPFGGQAGIPHVEETTAEVRPLAEVGIDVSHNGTTNGAGIDLSEAVWTALAMLDNTHVGWAFVA